MGRASTARDATGEECLDRVGERIGVVAVPRPGETVTLDSVVEFLRRLDVAPIKWPEHLRVVEELPRNSLGKVVRRDLPARFS